MDAYEPCPTLIGRLLPGESLRIETEPSECQHSRDYVYKGWFYTKTLRDVRQRNIAYRLYNLHGRG